MLKGLRIEERANGVFLVCDRGDVAHMVAGYADTQKKDAQVILAAVQREEETRRNRKLRHN